VSPPGADDGWDPGDASQPTETALEAPPRTSFGRSVGASLTRNQLAALHAVSAAVHGAAGIGEVLAAASRAAGEALRHAHLLLAVVDRRQQVLDVHLPTDGVPVEAARRVPLSVSRLEGILETGLASAIPNAPSPVLPVCQSLVAAPMTIGRGRPALLVVGSTEPGWFTDEDLPLIEGIAGHVAVAIDRAALLSREAKRTRQLRLVLDVARAALSTLDPKVVAERVVARIHRRFPGIVTTLWVHDAEAARLRIVALRGEGPLPVGTEFPADRGVLGRCVRTRQPELVRDTRRDPDYVAPARHAGRSELCVPILHANRVKGLLNLEAIEVDAFDEEDLTALQAVAGTLGAALENGNLMAEIRRFNETLQDQLAEATRSLEEANRKLAADRDRAEAENRSLKARLSREAVEILGHSRAIRETVDLARRVGASDVSCLIQGESGTGKELLARLVHQSSPRAAEPFITLDCAAIPETLLESTLFGHERGAFTGADRERTGLVESADGGTLFLDEIGDMSPALQAKLLRFLQNGEYYRVGGTERCTADVRIVSATHVDLQKAVAEERFRNDLYFRIASLVIHTPPLRERAEDISLLVRHFLERSAQGRPLRPTAALIQTLEAYPWPGNVRELENVVARMVVLAEGDELGPDLLPEEILEEASLPPATDPGRRREPSLILTLEEMELAAVTRALRRHGGDKKAAAADLGIALRTLYNKLQRHDIDVDAL
jgi:transcriptional regulator with GAF, ATPase, and Fis domain